MACYRWIGIGRVCAQKLPTDQNGDNEHREEDYKRISSLPTFRGLSCGVTIDDDVVVINLAAILLHRVELENRDDLVLL